MRKRWMSIVAGYSLLTLGLWAQKPPVSQTVIAAEPDAQGTRQALSEILDHYPPAVRGVLALDPKLLADRAYLAPYPSLVSFLETHREIGHNPAYYVGSGDRNLRMDRAGQIGEMWRSILAGFGVFLGFSMAIGLITWLIRTLIDYKRWSRLTKVQTEVHTKLLDRFTANEDLLTYMQSPAGLKFLQSAPISLDAAPRSLAAPLSRILWSLQAGIVLVAAGVGLQIAASRIAEDAAQPLHMLGILGVTLGIGFALSAAISFFISKRLGLIGKVADVS